jgi:hypothetical protein
MWENVREQVLTIPRGFSFWEFKIFKIFEQKLGLSLQYSEGLEKHNTKMGLHSQNKNHNHKLWPFERSKIKLPK